MEAMLNVSASIRKKDFRRGAHGFPGTVDIHGENPFPNGILNLSYRRKNVHDAGEVHQNIDGPQVVMASANGLSTE
jgi:hypothetical protein